MRNRIALQQYLALTFALCVVVGAENPRPLVSVLIQPEAGNARAVKVLISNDSRHKIWFSTCPDPYTVELTDSNGRLVPETRPQPPADQVQSMACARNILYTIKPGETWNSAVVLGDTYPLKAGTYSLKLLWFFQWKAHKTAQGTNWNTLTVSSNATRLMIVR
jgi:hypothetical protein